MKRSLILAAILALYGCAGRSPTEPRPIRHAEMQPGPPLTAFVWTCYLITALLAVRTIRDGIKGGKRHDRP